MAERPAQSRGIKVAETTQPLYFYPGTKVPIVVKRASVLHEDLGSTWTQRKGKKGPNLANRRDIDYPGKKFLIGAYSKYDPDTTYNDKTLSTDADMVGENLALDVFNLFLDPKRNTFDRDQYQSQLKFYERLLKMRGDILVPVFSGPELSDALEDARGRTAIVKSLEGIYGWEDNPHHLIEKLWKDGIRSLMPVHNDNSNLASGHLSERNGTDEGLSDRGEELVRYGLKRGMFMDLSHASIKTSRRIIEIYDEEHAKDDSVPPPIISHTGSRTLVDSTRNTDDEIAIEVARRGGIIGVMPAKWIVENPDNEHNASAMSVVRLIDHYLQIFSDADIEDPDRRIAIGTDFGGMGTESVITGIDTLQTLGPGLYLAMLKYGIPEKVISQILSTNAIDHYRNHLPKQSDHDLVA